MSVTNILNIYSHRLIIINYKGIKKTIFLHSIIHQDINTKKFSQTMNMKFK